MKLTKTQENALVKLTDEWQSAYKTEASLSTLDALVKRGLVERSKLPGWSFKGMQRVLVKYRLKQN